MEHTALCTRSAARSVAAVLALLGPAGARASQVFVEEEPHDLRSSVALAQLIVIAQDLKQVVTFKERVFPRRTHHQKAEETTYREYARQLKVTRVLRSSAAPAPAPGSVISVWVEPDYGEESMRLYHEQGLSESPIVRRPVPRARPAGDDVILFLVPHEKIFAPASGSTDEGLASLPEVEDLAHALSNPTLWYLEDRSAFHRDGEAVVIGEDGALLVHRVENKGKPRLRELLCEAQLAPDALARVRQLVAETDWSKLEFSGTLVPDETRPSLYVGLEQRRQWTIEPNPRLAEGAAYQAVLKLARARCAGAKPIWSKPEAIDFQRWPRRIRGITQ